MRMQSFPDWYTLHGSLSDMYKLIGNAVPVRLAYHLGQSVVESVSGCDE